MVFLSDSDMTTYQSRIEQWANAIKQEMSLLTDRNVNEQSSRLTALWKLSESDSHRRILTANARVLESCSTYDHQTPWKQTRKVGSARVLKHSSEYHSWRDRKDSSTLVCTGKLGCGKSVLLANLVDDLNLYTIRNQERPVAYFFCRHDISESLKSHTVIGSLARQILSLVSDLTIVDDIPDQRASVLVFERLLAILRRVLPPDFKAYVVLDGLDECDDVERKVLLQQLRKFQDSFALLVCVSFRLDVGNFDGHKLESLADQTLISIPEDNADIAEFISEELERCIESGKLTIGDPRLILEVQDSLLKDAEGMFLWVVFQIESLCAARTDEAIRQALADLPRDLPETFSRILQNSRKAGLDYQTRTLQLISAAHQPLTTEELREALSVVPGDASWNSARLLNSVHSALASCGSLISVDEEELTVRLIHRSIKQFLFSGIEDSAGTKFTMENANETMGRVIITYLSYGVFETQLSTTICPQIHAEVAPSRIIRLMDTSQSVRSIALKLLKTRAQNHDVSHVLAEAGKLFGSRPGHQFLFYSYAYSYWLKHVCFIPERDPAIYTLLLRLLRRKVVGLDPESDDSRAMLSWSSRNGHEEVVKMLLEMGVAFDSKSTIYSTTPLSSAAKNGHDAIVKLLLEKDVDIESKDMIHNRTPLSWAAKNGHADVVKLLLDNNADIESKDIICSRTPLSWAAKNGHADVVKLLLERGAGIQTKDSSNQTPLSWASTTGNAIVARLLLESGADSDTADDTGHTALSWAAMNGHTAIVKLLLDNGAYMESRDVSHGRTPLSWAAKNRHVDIVKLFLESGADIQSWDILSDTALLGR